MLARKGYPPGVALGVVREELDETGDAPEPLDSPDASFDLSAESGPDPSYERGDL
jgi:hypothetical protein